MLWQMIIPADDARRAMILPIRSKHVLADALFAADRHNMSLIRWRSRRFPANLVTYLGIILAYCSSVEVPSSGSPTRRSAATTPRDQISTGCKTADAKSPPGRGNERFHNCASPLRRCCPSPNQSRQARYQQDYGTGR